MVVQEAQTIMNAMLVWTIALIVDLLLWAAKFNILDRKINTLAAELVRMSKAEPDAANQERQKLLQRRSDIASWILLVGTVAIAALLPPLPREAVYTAVQSETVGLLLVASLIVALELELSPFFYRSIARMRLGGLLVDALKFAIAAGALFVIVTLPIAEQPIFMHPIYLYNVRRFLLGNMVFCGVLTLYREHRRRVRTGDIFRYGTFDSLRVAFQVLVFFNVVAVMITAPVMMGLQITGLLDPRQTIAAGLNFLAFIWTCVSVAYFILFLLRIINHARGFSWLDPPNWRVAIPHLRYHFGWYGFFQVLIFIVVPAIVVTWLTRSPKPLSWITTPMKLGALLLELVAIAAILLYRFRPAEARGLAWLRPMYWPHSFTLAFRQGFTPPLADIVRVTYLRALFWGATNDAALVDQVARGAAIAPLGEQSSARAIRFDIIGDPGEGDDSQLYPANRRHGAAKQMLSTSKARKSPQPNDPAPRSDDQLLRTLFEQPWNGEDDPESIDFTIISSDVIYPGGEMSDYERGFYRPNAPRDDHGRMFDYGQASERPDALSEILGRSTLCYAIPGNHDWYDSLHGFLMNFTYNAAIGRPRGPAARIKNLPWDWRPWRQVARRRVLAMRRRYRLRGAGGYAGQHTTHQHLSFFELTFGDAPLRVFGLDNGVTGSIDHIQYQWLERQLRALRSSSLTADHYVLVLVGNPLYVDGEFAGNKERPRPGPQPQRSYSPREIYELLRRYHVDVVMGGDTHAYQRYEVIYADDQGQQHTMHHIVNGGGGAYLSPPMDAGWLDFDRNRKPLLRLSRRAVYHPGTWGQDSTLDAQADQVVLYDVFPTFNQMIDKFIWSQVATEPAALWYERIAAWFRRRYILGALENGFTNALNHDASPLLQSYVRVELTENNHTWQLRLLPYMEQKGTMQRQIDRGFELAARHASPKFPIAKWKVIL